MHKIWLNREPLPVVTNFFPQLFLYDVAANITLNITVSKSSYRYTLTMLLCRCAIYSQKIRSTKIIDVCKLDLFRAPYYKILVIFLCCKYLNKNDETT